MNCRRVENLLSAYIDAELTGQEMLDIRAHLKNCSACAEECESLRTTKHLLGRMAQRTPSAELEALLLLRATEASRPMAGWLPLWAQEIVQGGGWPLRARPLLATAMLSLAGVALLALPLDRSETHRGNIALTPSPGSPYAAPLLPESVAPAQAVTTAPVSAAMMYSYPLPMHSASAAPTIQFAGYGYGSRYAEPPPAEEYRSEAAR